MIRIPSFLADWLLSWLQDRMDSRMPDVRIGQPGNWYMWRWHVWKRNKQGLNLYAHQMFRDDDDRALHDHPSWSLSIVLTDGLGEWYQTSPDAPMRLRWFKKGQIVWRAAHWGHRLILRAGATTPFTLFLMGPDLREWGFWCPQGWRSWREYGAASRSGSANRGCD